MLVDCASMNSSMEVKQCWQQHLQVFVLDLDGGSLSGFYSCHKLWHTKQPVVGLSSSICVKMSQTQPIVISYNFPILQFGDLDLLHRLILFSSHVTAAPGWSFFHNLADIQTKYYLQSLLLVIQQSLASLLNQNMVFTAKIWFNWNVSIGTMSIGRYQ